MLITENILRKVIAEEFEKMKREKTMKEAGGDDERGTHFNSKADSYASYRSQKDIEDRYAKASREAARLVGKLPSKPEEVGKLFGEKIPEIKNMPYFKAYTPELVVDMLIHVFYSYLPKGSTGVIRQTALSGGGSSVKEGNGGMINEWETSEVIKRGRDGKYYVYEVDDEGNSTRMGEAEREDFERLGYKVPADLDEGNSMLKEWETAEVIKKGRDGVYYVYEVDDEGNSTRLGEASEQDFLRLGYKVPADLDEGNSMLKEWETAEVIKKGRDGVYYVYEQDDEGNSTRMGEASREDFERLGYRVPADFEEGGGYSAPKSYGKRRWR